jgi:acyl-CoA reductase-like NAD-dependent aldehyde dehydrogenase
MTSERTDSREPAPYASSTGVTTPSERNEIDLHRAQALDAEPASPPQIPSAIPAEPVPVATRRMRAVLDAIDPATRELIAQVFATAPERVSPIVAGAQRAALEWGDLSFKARAAALGRLRDRIAMRAPEIAETIARGMGKPLIEALTFEVARVLATLDACAAYASDAPADERAALETLPALLGRYGAVLLTHAPRAVVCVIAPVYAPFELALTPAVLALIAGNAVIVKTSSSAPLVGVLIEQLFDEALADFPGPAQVVHGTSALGSVVARAPGVDAVLFAGATPEGRRLEGELALLKRPALFDLVRADALIVCEDANLERAANAAVFGRFSNNGQGCSGIRRVYVARTVADAFTHKVMHKVRALKSGPYTNPFCELGPLANGRDLQHLRAVLQEAIDQNAQLLTGGFPAHVSGHDHGERRGAHREGWFWPPAVLSKVDHSMRVVKEPVCGPILPILTFTDDSEAISFGNNTAYGFDACVFSSDLARAARIAAGLNAGTVVVNDVFVSGAPPARDGVALNDGRLDREAHWFPYSAAKLRAIEHAMSVDHGVRRA